MYVKIKSGGKLFIVEICDPEISINYKFDLLISPKSNKIYLESTKILDTFLCTKLSIDSSRRCLVREAINFLHQRSGNYPKREDKIALAEAIIQLLPAFKVENSNCGGIDLFYNPESNSGYIVGKLKNFNKKIRMLS
ncbi:hypothetical protein FF38_04227 [Lucilia cuprina]|uniref:Uncharacterized protein n=1 Tax=Lucilia cuprina TaxID=7375 RepID=A0A0L0C187_LUCCU|nr:hypothetical protein FF38_04227 [Lucilia cuprina]